MLQLIDDIELLNPNWSLVVVILIRDCYKLFHKIK